MTSIATYQSFSDAARIKSTNYVLVLPNDQLGQITDNQAKYLISSRVIQGRI